MPPYGGCCCCDVESNRAVCRGWSHLKCSVLIGDVLREERGREGREVVFGAGDVKGVGRRKTRGVVVWEGCHLGRVVSMRVHGKCSGVASSRNQRCSWRCGGCEGVGGDAVNAQVVACDVCRVKLRRGAGSTVCEDCGVRIHHACNDLTRYLEGLWLTVGSSHPRNSD